AVLDAVALAALLLEDDDLVALDVAEHGGRDGRAADGRGADLDLVARDEEDAVEGEGVADLRLLAGYVELGVLLDFELLTGDIDDGVHTDAGLGTPCAAGPGRSRSRDGGLACRGARWAKTC